MLHDSAFGALTSSRTADALRESVAEQRSVAAPNFPTVEHDIGSERKESSIDPALANILKYHLAQPGTQSPSSYAARQFLAQAVFTTFAVEAVNNLPLSVGSTQVTLLFVEPRGNVLAVLPDLPSASFIQQENSNSSSPTFSRASSVSAYCRPKVQLAIVVACVDHRTLRMGILGHAVIAQYNKRGVFEVRLRAGELNSTLTAADTVDPLYLPLTSVVIRINAAAGDLFSGGGDDNNRGVVKLFDFTANEERLLADRIGHTNYTMASLGLSKPQCEILFRDVMSGTGSSSSLDLSFYSPYNEDRGVAVVVHAIHFAVPTDRSPLQLFKVVVEVDGRLAFTQYHDWDSDAFRPRFKDAYFVFNHLRITATGIAVFRIYRMRFQPTLQVDVGTAPTNQALGLRDIGAWTLEEYAWSFSGLQSRVGNALRHSPTMALPLYAGRVPENLSDIMRHSASVEDALAALSNRGLLKNVRSTIGNHRPIVTVSIADPARLEEVVKERISSRVESRIPLRVAFGRVWENLSHVQADANAFFRAGLFTAP